MKFIQKCDTLLLLFSVAIAISAKTGSEYPSITDNGIWTWYGDPKAVYHHGDLEKTYTGWVTDAGDIEVASYDHQTNEIEKTYLRTGSIDDHNHPSLLVLEDGKILVAQSEHTSNAIHLWRSQEAESVSSFDKTAEISTKNTYPNLVRLPAEGNKIFLFFRGINKQPTLVTSSDHTNWSDPVKIIQGADRPYVKYASNGNDRIHIVYENGHRKSKHNTYHLYYEDGAFYTMNGTLIRTFDNLPVLEGEADLIYDADAEGKSGTVWDIAIDKNGYPVILFVKLTSKHEYYYIRWDGSEWQRTQLLSSAGGSMGSESGFSGGLALNHTDPNMVFLSRKVDNMFEVEKWNTNDKGQTWTSIAVTENSQKKNTRPCVPRGVPANKTVLLWLYGDYEHYTGAGKYSTAIKMTVFKDETTTIQQMFTIPATRGTQRIPPDRFSVTGRKLNGIAKKKSVKTAVGVEVNANRQKLSITRRR